jgi:hypothetical protein
MLRTDELVSVIFMFYKFGCNELWRRVLSKVKRVMPD